MTGGAASHNERGVALRRRGEPRKAIASFDAAIAVDPDCPDPYINRGNALKDLRRLEDALANYDRALTLQPGNVAALSNLGNALSRLQRPEAAVACYDRALAVAADQPILHNNRAGALHELGRLAEALDGFTRTVILKPDHAPAWCHRGNGLSALDRQEEAVWSYGRALAIRPDFAEACSNRATVLKELERLDEALAGCAAAIALMPERAELYNNRGNVLQELARFDEAVSSYDRAVLLKFDTAHANRATALNTLGRFGEAQDGFESAIALQPDYAEAIWNRALFNLLHGEYGPGWRDYEARKIKKKPVGNRQFAQPLWRGDTDLHGKTIFVHWEQGFGDTIQFCRYVKSLEESGARVLFAPQNPLKPLMRSLSPSVAIVDIDDGGLRFDLHSPLLSLPLAFGTDLHTVPGGEAYLAADPERVAVWRTRLGPRSRPRIGLAWRGSALKKNDRRCIDLALFQAVFGDFADFVSVQKEISPDDAAFLAERSIPHFGADLRDFAETAALCAEMDLVISIDTAVAHLAAALGRPTWVLLPWFPDWRWLLDREDSPWYPTMRLFRQRRRGDWTQLLGEVEAALRAHYPNS